MKCFLQGLLLLSLSLFVASCEDNTTIVNPPGNAVRVSGTVFGWRCGVGDWYNNDINGDLRITTRTGEHAKISFVRLNGLSFTNYCDDSSRYYWVLDEGAYYIVFESGLSWPPDTIKNVYVSKDTTIDLNLVYDFLIADTLEVMFLYPSIDDTFGLDSEWNLIKRLNMDIRGMLNIGYSTNPSDFRHTNFGPYNADVSYRVPILRDSYHLWTVYQRAEEVLEDYTQIYPGYMHAVPHGVYPCLDK